MTGTSLIPARPSAAEPAPRALIDYDFHSVLGAPPKRRLVLWLMALLGGRGHPSDRRQAETIDTFRTFGKAFDYRSHEGPMDTAPCRATRTAAPCAMKWIPGGTFRMGADLSYPEEGPAHDAAVDGFWIDEYAITNADFASFVAATGYVTVAERPLDPAAYPGIAPARLVPGAAVFFLSSGRVNMSDIQSRWAYVPDANWRHPEGPDSTIDGHEREPVVQVAYEDAAAYAAWAGKVLPTETEWEFAARGGLDGAQFCWGDEFNPGGQWMANTWQGQFPFQNLPLDGFAGRAPVGSFPPNGYGLYDMAGNVWEWTADWWSERHTPNAPAPCCGSGGAQPLRFSRRVIKGGSYLCAPNYCRRYRPAARYPQATDTGTCHIGFRCVIRV